MPLSLRRTHTLNFRGANSPVRSDASLHGSLGLRVRNLGGAMGGKVVQGLKHHSAVQVPEPDVAGCDVPQRRRRDVAVDVGVQEGRRILEGEGEASG